MKAKQRTLILLLVLVVAAGAALWVLDRSNTQAEKAASAASEGTISLSSFSAADVEQIEYTYQGETYTLNNTDGSWTLAQDPEYHLDASACNTMVTALSALNAKRQLTAQAGEDYGLDTPLVTVIVTAAGETTTILFGAENPVTGDLYAQKKGDDSIYTVASSKAACFELGKAELFGSFNPAGLVASSIEKIDYTLADGTSVSLTANSEPVQTDSSSSEEETAESVQYETVWRLTDEPDTDLDETKVNALLAALGGYVSGQITNADPDAYGFAHPQVTVRAETPDGTVVLAYASGADGCYLMQEGDDSIYSVDISTVQALLCTADELKAE